MPGRNSIKTYVEDSIYHAYNRGVEKRKIFQDEQDYKVFLNYLKEYLLPIEPNKPLKTFYLRGRTFKAVARQPKNYNGEIELLAYCLMPNHIHLLIKQKGRYSLKKFMQSILTRYSLYFNKKYERVGPLFQGKYKAIIVNDEAYLLHLSRYIHLNPIEYSQNLVQAYSSFADYLGLRKTKWVNPSLILYFFNNKVLSDFKKVNNYGDFVERYAQDSKNLLGNLTLE